MCRHLAWLGRPRSLSSLVFEPPHSLRVQSYAPRRQKHGRINADGWGVGFYPAASDEPARWRSTRPLWSEASFASVAPHIESRCVIAAVRSATPGMPIDESATAPFTDGRWLLSHNGRVDTDVLRADLPVESVCDAAMLAATVFATDVDLGTVIPAVGARDPAARLNVLATNGKRVVATTWGDTLSYLVDDAGVVVASEPYDDDGRWVDVPDRHLVEVSRDGVTLTPLEKTT